MDSALPVRIVDVDFYMNVPIPQVDVTYSEFRGSTVSQVPVIRIFGSTNHGKKICLHIHGVFPYLYIPYDGSDSPNNVMYKIAANLDKALNIGLGQTSSNTQHIYKILLVSGIPFYGYHSKKHQFLKIYLYNPLLIRRVSNLLQNEALLGKIYQPHETHLSYILQFMIDYNLHGMSNILVSDLKYRCDSSSEIRENSTIEYMPTSILKLSTCELEADTLSEHILNRKQIESGNLSANPGIAALWEDEMQRRRNKNEESQLPHFLSLDKTDMEPTESHKLFKQAVLDRLAYLSQQKEQVDENISVYPAKCPNNTQMIDSFSADFHSPYSSQSFDNTLESIDLNDTITDDTFNNTDSTLNADGYDLMQILQELRGNTAGVEEDSILSQIDIQKDEEEDLDLTMSLAAVTNLFDDTLTIPQLDGQYSETDNSSLGCLKSTISPNNKYCLGETSCTVGSVYNNNLGEVPKAKSELQLRNYLFNNGKNSIYENTQFDISRNQNSLDSFSIQQAGRYGCELNEENKILHPMMSTSDSNKSEYEKIDRIKNSSKMESNSSSKQLCASWHLNDVEIAAVKPKRQRGRPKILHENKAQTGTENIEITDVELKEKRDRSKLLHKNKGQIGTEGIEITDVEPEKKRGRPKILHKNKGQIGAQDIEITDVKPKRKRGRAKLLHNNKGQIGTQDIEITDVEPEKRDKPKLLHTNEGQIGTQDIEITDVKPKRKRGTKLLLHKNKEQTGTQNIEITDVELKKKRGRPNVLHKNKGQIGTEDIEITDVELKKKRDGSKLLNKNKVQTGTRNIKITDVELKKKRGRTTLLDKNKGQIGTEDIEITDVKPKRKRGRTKLLHKNKGQIGTEAIEKADVEPKRKRPKLLHKNKGQIGSQDRVEKEIDIPTKRNQYDSLKPNKDPNQETGQTFRNVEQVDSQQRNCSYNFTKQSFKNINCRKSHIDLCKPLRLPGRGRRNEKMELCKKNDSATLQVIDTNFIKLLELRNGKKVQFQELMTKRKKEPKQNIKYNLNDSLLFSGLSESNESSKIPDKTQAPRAVRKSNLQNIDSKNCSYNYDQMTDESVAATVVRRHTLKLLEKQPTGCKSIDRIVKKPKQRKKVSLDMPSLDIDTEDNFFRLIVPKENETVLKREETLPGGKNKKLKNVNRKARTKTKKICSNRETAKTKRKAYMAAKICQKDKERLNLLNIGATPSFRLVAGVKPHILQDTDILSKITIISDATLPNWQTSKQKWDFYKYVPPDGDDSIKKSAHFEIQFKPTDNPSNTSWPFRITCVSTNELVSREYQDKNGNIRLKIKKSKEKNGNEVSRKNENGKLNLEGRGRNINDVIKNQREVERKYLASLDSVMTNGMIDESKLLANVSHLNEDAIDYRGFDISKSYIWNEKCEIRETLLLDGPNDSSSSEENDDLKRPQSKLKKSTNKSNDKYEALPINLSSSKNLRTVPAGHCPNKHQPVSINKKNTGDKTKSRIKSQFPIYHDINIDKVKCKLNFQSSFETTVIEEKLLCATKTSSEQNLLITDIDEIISKPYIDNHRNNQLDEDAVFTNLVEKKSTNRQSASNNILSSNVNIIHEKMQQLSKSAQYDIEGNHKPMEGTSKTFFNNASLIQSQVSSGELWKSTSPINSPEQSSQKAVPIDEERVLTGGSSDSFSQNALRSTISYDVENTKEDFQRLNLEYCDETNFVKKPSAVLSDSSSVSNLQNVQLSTKPENLNEDSSNLVLEDSYGCNFQLTPYQRIIDFVEIKENSNDSKIVRSYEPQSKAPTRFEVEQSLKSLKIPKFSHQEPFYSNVEDITGMVEVGRNVLKIKSNTSVDKPEFETSFDGIEQYRKIYSSETLPSKHSLKTNTKMLKLSFCKERNCVIEPLKKPPTKETVISWLKVKSINVVVNPPKPNRRKVYLQSSPNRDDDESDVSLTLTPLTPEYTKEDVVSESNETTPKSSVSSCRTSPILNGKKARKLKNPLLLKSALLSQTKENSYRLSGTSLNNTYGFKNSIQDLQNARTSIGHNHVTILAMELHIRTRGDLKPNPEHDSIRAIFYSLHNDFDDSCSKPKKCEGLFAINSIPTSPNKSPAPILEGAGVTCDVKYAQSEDELIKEFVKFVQDWDPDILIGYEIQMSSWGYLVERAYVLGTNLPVLLSRVKDKHFKHKDPESNDLKIVGRILLDFWRLLRHEIPLQSYTFENIVYHILHQRTPCYSFRDLSFWWDHPSSLHRHRTVNYYMFRVQGVMKLLNQLDLIGRTSELARLFGILFYEVLSRGSQFRVESMMLRLAKPLSYVAVSPSIQQRAKMRAPEYIPLILEPESKLYVDPVIVLDFQSLYPSVMIAYNYCFSTCVGRVENLGKNAPSDFGATQLKVSHRRIKMLTKSDNLNFSPCGVGFVKKQVRDGILPRMLREILDTRLMVKNSMKENKNDSVLQKVLHSRQLGLKLIANVTYGYTSANFSGRMPSVEIADSVVSKGRETLQRAITMVDENVEWGAKVVYGDTDSLFVLVAGRSREEAFKIGKQIAEAVTNDNPDPVKLKFEKVYHPCILQTKKRYVGYMYESVDQAEPVYDAKGIETVRRDGCPAVSKMLEKCLRLLFETKDVSLIKKYVLRQFNKILSGRISLQDLTFAKEYRGVSGYKPGACVPSLELARKWMAVDKRNEPRRSERVPYVIVNGSPGLPLIRLVRSPIELLNDPSLRPNALYYITRVIIPPINRCFNLIGADLNQWFNLMPRKLVQYLPTISPTKKSTISQYFISTICAVCGVQTQNDLCDGCVAKPMETTVLLNEKIRYWEQSNSDCNLICYSCSQIPTDSKCVSLDCSVLYRRNQTTRDVQQADYVRQILSRQDFDYF